MAGAGGTRMRYATLCVTMSLVEVRKTNALSTSRESLQIVVQYPQQSYALRRTDEMLGENITSADQTHVLFDYEATIYLTDLSRRLLKLPPPAGLREEMAEHEGDARLIMARLTGEVAALESGLVSAAKDFTQAELTQIRRMKNVADSTRRKLFDLLKETTGSFIRQNQEPGRRAPMLLRDAMGLFAFRYSLCMLLYYMEWVRIGRQTGKKLPLRVNDVVDMQLAAMGTFFNGVLSADENLQIVSNTARGVLRGFGAYVGGLARAAAAAGERRRRGRCKSGRSGLDRSHMRFLANGPSIPDDLLIARDAGDVIFFCGAGVSRHRAGLPDFLKLGGDVIDLLGAGQKSLARKLFRRIKELEPIDGVGGLIATDRIFSLLEREFEQRDVQNAVARAIKPADNPDLSAHRTLIDLSRGRDGTVRLVTTNFDLLFEEAAPSVACSGPPVLPDPRAAGFGGIVHLHGRVDADYSRPSDEEFIVSSADFGRA